MSGVINSARIKDTLQNSNGRIPYVRVQRVMLSGTDQFVDVPQGPYRAITMGPRHTMGPVLVFSKDFGGEVDRQTSVINVPSVSIGPRNSWVGFAANPLQIMIPQLGASIASITAAQQVPPPVCDLLFWYEPPPFVPQRSDLSVTGSAQTGAVASLFVPTGGRNQINVLIRAIGATSSTRVELVSYAGPINGYVYASRRTHATLAVTVAQPAILSWGESGVPTPTAPLVGENGFVPDGLIFTEAGAGSTTSIQVNARD